MSELRPGAVAEPAGIKPASLGPRVLTAVLYGIVVLGALLLGPLATGVAFGVMAGWAAAEFFSIVRREARQPNEFFGVVAAGVMPVAAALWGLAGLSAVVTALFAASLFWHVAFTRVRTADTAETIFGALYTGFLLGYLVLVRELHGGLVISLALVVSVWCSDMSAFFFGSLFGRHRLAPSISPKKSVEGFLAGMVACVAVWAVLPLVAVPGVVWPHVPMWLALVTGFAVSVSSVIGDLAESRFK
ncbi:MAG: phosphatidate cytidylyltransferase, partial [Actinobacteria bacterium]